MCAESHNGIILAAETEEIGEKIVSVPLCPPQIPHILTQARTRASVVTGQQLTREPWHGRMIEVVNLVVWFTFWIDKCQSCNAWDAISTSSSLPSPASWDVPWLRRLVSGLSQLKPDFAPGQFVWDLWWTEWHWNRFISEFLGFPLSVSFHW
jgi:hypothetical protein